MTFVDVPSSAEAGDTIIMTLTQPDGSKTTVNSAVPFNWDGSSAIPVTIPAYIIGQYTVSAVVELASGPTSASSETPFTLVRDDNNSNNGSNTQQAPVIHIPEAAGDEFVTFAEAKDGVQVMVDVPDSAQVGDGITLTLQQPNGTQTVVESAVPFNWDGQSEIPVTVPAYIIGAYTVSAVVELAGGDSPASNVAPFTLVRDESGNNGDNDSGESNNGDQNNGNQEPLDAPIIFIPEAQGDQLIDASEVLDGVQITVNLPQGAASGDKVTLNVTSPDGQQSNLVTAVPSQWDGQSPLVATVPAYQDGQYSVAAFITDDDGQSSALSNSETFILDLTDEASPTISDAPVIAIPEALGDGIVDENEVTDGVQILVTLPTGTEVGDTVEIALVMPNGQTVESEHTVPFTWSPGQTLPITLPAFLDGEYDVTAQVSKSDGSQSPVSQPAEFTLDARDDAPDLTPLQTPSISVNEAGADGLINGAESADGVQVQVYLPDQITQGDW